MSYEGHTPGPWRVEGWDITDSHPNREKRKHMAYIPKDYERNIANAELLAAAPYLLAERDRYKTALQEISQRMDGAGYAAREALKETENE